MISAQKVADAIKKADEKIQYEHRTDYYICTILDDNNKVIMNYDTPFIGHAQDFLLIYRPYYTFKYLEFSDSLSHTLGLHTRKSITWKNGVYGIIDEINNVL